jgi:hypothetical protein
MVFFSSGRGGGDQIDYGYKGKGVTSHLLVEKSGKTLAVTSTPASGDERKQVNPLLGKICGLINRVWKKGKTPILEADIRLRLNRPLSKLRFCRFLGSFEPICASFVGGKEAHALIFLHRSSEG